LNRSTHRLIVFGLYAALALAWTWPMPAHLASRVAFDPGDPFLNTWILWWNAHAVPFTDAWWNPPIFYPMRGALALSEHLAGVGLFTTPILLLGGTPALAYNVALLLSCALSGFCTYLLVEYLTRSPLAAGCAGLSYAIAPFRAGQLSHLQVLTSQWLPLMLLGLHGYLETGRRRWLVLFGVAWVIQGLSNGYYLLFAPVLVAAWLCWFTLAGGRWKQFVEISGAWLLASLPLVPVLLKYREVHGALGLSRSRGMIMAFSGSVASFLKPPPMLAVWPQTFAISGEDMLFPGVTIVVVVVISLAYTFGARATKSADGHRGGGLSGDLPFYVCAALLMAALTFGPAGSDDGVLGWLKPYQWLVQLPGFNGIRVPVRFGMLFALCLAVAGGIGLAQMMPTSRRWRAVLVGCVAIGLLLDGAIQPLTGSPPPGRIELPKVPAAAVLELPPDDTGVSVGAMFRSMSHRLPLINGYSGHIPPHYDILGQSLRRDDPSAVIELARGRTLLLLVAERNDPAGDFRRLVESIPGVQRGEVTGAGVSYVLPAQPRDAKPRGSTVHAFTATSLPREHAVIDLGTARVLRTLEFPLRNHYSDFGRRFAIETSDDGTNWRMTWEGWTAGPAVAGALEDQVVVPMRFMLPDISTRYLRIHPAPEWLVKELKVLGP
jgi:hypothetical protein